MKYLLLNLVFSFITYNSFAENLLEISSLKCSLPEYSGAETKNGKFSKTDREKLKKPYEIVVTSIDYKAGTAKLVGNIGTADLVVIPGLYGATFIEFTPVGNPSVLHVANVANYPATVSRDMFIVNELTSSKYYGKCVAF